MLILMAACRPARESDSWIIQALKLNVMVVRVKMAISIRVQELSLKLGLMQN